MTGIIVSIPPTVEVPPGNNASNPSSLPAVTYLYAVLNVPQTWTAKQTFPLGNITLQAADIVGLSSSATIDTTNAANITSGTLPAGRLPAFTGDITTSVGSVATTLAIVNANIGSFGTATQTGQFTVNAKGLTTAAANVTITPAVGSITGLGTGIVTALGVNVGTAGAPVVNGGVLGTPSSGVGTNLTGTASGLTAGNVTTNANLTGPITSAGNATSIASQTGTGTKFVVDTSPTLVTPILGVATGTTYNKVTITAPATAATLTLIDGTTLTGPAATGTAMTLGNVETVTGAKTFGSAGAVGKLAVAGTTSGSTIVNATAVASGTLTLPAATDTLVGKATTDTLTNKTFDSAGTGNVLQVSGVTVSRGQYPGETTTGSATAGNIGEYIESVIAAGSAISLTTTTFANLTSISLTAGDWDVDMVGQFVSTATTSVTQYYSSISTTSVTADTTAGRANINSINATVNGGSTQANAVVPVRFSLSGTTTIFAVVRCAFTASTMTCYGIIRARRVR